MAQKTQDQLSADAQLGMGPLAGVVQAADDGFVGVGVALDDEGRVFHGQLAEDVEEALLVALLLGLHGKTGHGAGEVEGYEVDVVLVVGIVEHAVELDLLDLGNGADVTRQEFIHLDRILALELVEVGHLERPLAVADEELHVLLHGTLMHAENTDLAHVGIGHHLEDVGQHVLGGVWLGVEGRGVTTRFALVEGRRVALGGVGGEAGQDVQQLLDAGTGLGRGKQNGDQMPLAQRLLEGRVKIGHAGVGAVLQVLGQEILVFFDDLVDEGAVGGGNGLEIGVAGSVLQHFDHVGGTVGGQVEDHALFAEALADVGHQRRQIEVLGVDLVDDDHAAELPLGGVAHHALGHQLDAGLGIDHHQGGIHARQGGNGLAGEIGVARGVGQVDVGVLVAEIDQGGGQGVAGLLLQGIGIADGAALLDTALGSDGAGGVQQRFGQAGLAGGTVADEGDGAKGLGGVSGHGGLP